MPPTTNDSLAEPALLESRITFRSIEMAHHSSHWRITMTRSHLLVLSHALNSLKLLCQHQPEVRPTGLATCAPLTLGCCPVRHHHAPPLLQPETRAISRRRVSFSIWMATTQTGVRKLFRSLFLTTYRSLYYVKLMGSTVLQMRSPGYSSVQQFPSLRYSPGQLPPGRTTRQNFATLNRCMASRLPGQSTSLSKWITSTFRHWAGHTDNVLLRIAQARV